MALRRRKGRMRELVTAELELMPMLNVFIAIIPLLLLSAAFVPVAVIQTTLPGSAAAAPSETATLDLAIHILRDQYVLEVDGRILRSVARGDSADATRAELTAALGEIAAAHTGNREVRIVSEPTTRYEEIIDVMDASRAAGLPEAALAQAGED